MKIRGIGSVRAQRNVGDPLQQKRVGMRGLRLVGSRVLFVAAIASLMAGGFLAVSSVAPAASASPTGITVHCPADNLQTAINAVAPGLTLLVDGTCTGDFSIQRLDIVWTPRLLTVSVYLRGDARGRGLEPCP